MIFDVYECPTKIARFDCDSSLLFCQTLGFFDKYLEMDEFFESKPMIRVLEEDDRDIIIIDLKYNEELINEIFDSMERLGFVSVDIPLGLERRLYRFVHFRK